MKEDKGSIINSLHIMKTLVLFLVLVCWGAAVPQYAPPAPKDTAEAEPPLFETSPAPEPDDTSLASEQPADAAPPAVDEQYNSPVASPPAPAPPAQQYGLPSL